MNILDRIEAINQSSGNGKLHELKKCADIKGIFEYAYNPFKKYYLTSEKAGLDSLQGTAGGMEINFATRVLLDQLIKREITGNAAMEAVCDHMVILEPNSAEVFKRIINKDLRCGTSIKTINKVFPGLIPLVYNASKKPPVMLLKTFAPNKAKYPCLAAVKKDGDRGIYPGQGKLISRAGKPYIGMDHIEKDLEHPVDGELVIPGMIFDEGSGLIRNNNPTPDAVLYIFDAPFAPGSKMERYQWMKENIRENNHIKIIPHFVISSYKTLKKLYNWALKEGEEGIVVYDMDSQYEDKRSYDWMRMVPIKSADCEVIGFYEGNGKNAGSLGGIIINYKGHTVKVGTGFKEKILKKDEKNLVNEVDRKLLTARIKKPEGYTLEEISPLWLNIREFIWLNKESFLGIKAKIEYKEKTKAGSLRQPRFKGWRFDK